MIINNITITTWLPLKLVWLICFGDVFQLALKFINLMDNLGPPDVLGLSQDSD